MKPDSTDLRMRVVQVYENREGAMRQLATPFRVSLSCVHRLLTHDRETGGVAPKPHGGGAPAKVDLSGREGGQALVRAAPDATLRELCQQFAEQYQRRVSIATMSRVLAQLQLTRKKKRFTPRNKRVPMCRGSGPPSARRSPSWIPELWSLSTNLAATKPWLGTMAVPLGGSVPLVPSPCNAGDMSPWSGRWGGAGWWRP
jgi:transposase